MPLYEYECRECHRRTEKIQKFSDPELTVCPFCSGSLERTLTAPAFHFAGGGWYKDLYSSSKPEAANTGGEGSSPAAAAPSGGSGSESAAPAAAPAPSSTPGAAPAAAPSTSASSDKS